MNPYALMGAQVGIGALQSFFGGRVESIYARGDQAAQQAQALANRAAELEQLTMGLSLQARQNDAIAKADIQTLINTNIQASLLGINLSAQKRAEAQNRVVVKRNRAAAIGSAMTDAAAAGTIGASVNAVVSDIKRQSADANAAIADQGDVDRFNYSVSIDQLYRSYEQGVQRFDTSLPSTPSTLIMGDRAPKGQSFGSALLGSTLNVGMGYLTDSIRLGLGNSSRNNSNTGASSGGVTLYGLRR